jgi:hypothetical protein
MVESRSLELFDEIAVWIVEVGKHFSDHRSSGCFVERIPEIFELLVQSTIWIHGAQEVGFGCHGSLSLP